MPRALLAAAFLAAVGGGAWLSASPEPAVPAALDLSGFDAFLPGDLVFRKGRSLTSRAVLAADGEAAYSHVGIADLEGGRVYVIHAAPGEGDRPQPLQREPIASYLAPEKASAAAVYRLLPASTEAGRAAAAAARGYHRRGLLFDDRLDLESPDALYCTELVWRAYLAAGIELGDVPPTQMSNFVVRGPVLLPSDLLGSSRLRALHVFGTGEEIDDV